MKQFISIMVLALLSFSTVSSAGGLADGWQQLGREKVNAIKEYDEMRIASKGFIKQLALEVQGSAVYFESVSIHLANGQVLDLPVRSIIKAGERSRVIDLPGEARVIRKVVFVHEKLRDSGKARVILWGRK